MWYTYNQNNSGGRFDYDEMNGISHYVIVEADSPSDADRRAENIGIYFDDDYSIDCSCCGTRWGQAWDDGDEVPSIYSESVVDYLNNLPQKSWLTHKWIKGYEIFVHRKNGDFIGLWHSDNALSIEGQQMLEIES